MQSFSFWIVFRPLYPKSKISEHKSVIATEEKPDFILFSSVLKESSFCQFHYKNLHTDNSVIIVIAAGRRSRFRFSRCNRYPAVKGVREIRTPDNRVAVCRLTAWL